MGRRFGQILGVLAVAALIVVPAIPLGLLGLRHAELATDIERTTLLFSVSQKWKMYSPNPRGGMEYLNLTAHYKDGRTEDLEETEVERRGWGTVWDWEKSRKHVWLSYLTAEPDENHPRRTWFLRGVCIREARRRGELPEKITVQLLRRRFAPPDRVRAGEPGLGPEQRRELEAQTCQTPEVWAMLEADPGPKRDI